MAFTSINYWKYLREQSPTSHHSLDITRTQYVFVFSELFRVNPRSAIGKYMDHCNCYHLHPAADDTSPWFYACAQGRKRGQSDPYNLKITDNKFPLLPSVPII